MIMGSINSNTSCSSSSSLNNKIEIPHVFMMNNEQGLQEGSNDSNGPVSNNSSVKPGEYYPLGGGVNIVPQEQRGGPESSLIMDPITKEYFPLGRPSPEGSPEINQEAPYIPQGNNPWPEGLTQNNLDEEYMKKRGYEKVSEELFEIDKPGISDYTELTGIVTEESVKQPTGEHVANFLEDAHEEYLANGGDPETDSKVPYEKLSFTDKEIVRTLIEENTKNIKDNTPQTREALRNLPR